MQRIMSERGMEPENWLETFMNPSGARPDRREDQNRGSSNDE
jgi:hypothetical protein